MTSVRLCSSILSLSLVKSCELSCNLEGMDCVLEMLLLIILLVAASFRLHIFRRFLRHDIHSVSWGFGEDIKFVEAVDPSVGF